MFDSILSIIANHVRNAARALAHAARRAPSFAALTIVALVWVVL